MNKNKGFTLLELMVVIAITAIVSTIIITWLGSSKSRGADSKIMSHLRSMTSQAQLFVGANTAVVATTATIPLTGAAGGSLFTDTNATNSLYRLANGLPTNTAVYYAKNGISPLAGGYWAFAASLSTGSFCVDYTGVGKISNTGTAMTTATASTIYPNLAGSYSCN